MPPLRDQRIPIDPERYQPVRREPHANPLPITPQPVLPVHLRPSPVMLSSLPSIATNVDGTTRQFYANQMLPTRRLIQPS